MRELKNVLERALLFTRGSKLDLGHFSGLDLPGGGPALVEESDDLMKQMNAHLLRVLAKCGGDKKKACQTLGISLSALYHRLGKQEQSGQDP